LDEAYKILEGFAERFGESLGTSDLNLERETQTILQENMIREASK